MKIFDNVTEIVRDDMAQTIKKGSKVSIAAACFSMYAYNVLKKQLESVDELRFIFTSPTFVTEKAEKQQLKRLQEEVVDIEDMSTGISIMDLGLNEFRLDLLEYIKTHDDLDKKPKGLHAVVPASEENPEGVIFVLRNINNSINIDNQNRIHPFYMVYIGIDGDIVCDYLNPKKLLDTVRLLCRGKKEPVLSLCRKFNEETDDGRNMQEVSELLNDAINSIIDVKEDSDIDSLFSAGGTSALMSEINGLDDFELICFLVVK